MYVMHQKIKINIKTHLPAIFDKYNMRMIISINNIIMMAIYFFGKTMGAIAFAFFQKLIKK